MKAKEVIVKKRNKESFTAKIMIPENIDEAITVIGEDKSLKWIIDSYVLEQTAILRRGRPFRKKTLKIELALLTPEQLDNLRQLGFKF